MSWKVYFALFVVITATVDIALAAWVTLCLWGVVTVLKLWE